jgi:hypothetical protein
MIKDDENRCSIDDSLVIDVTLLLDNPGYAVHCKSAEDAQQFVNYVVNHLPSFSDGWSDADSHFNSVGGTIYTFYYRTSNQWLKSDTLMWGNATEFRTAYTIVPFAEIVVADIDESDVGVDFLFGG